MACEEHHLNQSWSGGRRLYNDRKDDASHCTDELYMGMVHLNVHLDPRASVNPSAGVSPDKGGCGVALEGE